MDRYERFRFVAQGGMGIVYWAIDTDLQRQVAFKMVQPAAGALPGSTTPTPLHAAPPDPGTPTYGAFHALASRFLQEAWVTAGLDHPGIIPVYEVGRTPSGIPYYTMRFVRGSRTLASAIESLRGRPLDARLELLDPFLKVCDAVRYAHAHGVVHRDLKPENVALGEFGEAVVLDWGLAKVLRGGSGTRLPAEDADAAWKAHIRSYREAAHLLTLPGGLGTPGYMAPEAACGRHEEVGPRSDIYSLGAILFRILTGRLPFEGETYGALLDQLMNEEAPDPRAVDPEIPAGIAAECRCALARDPAARHPSADAFAQRVRAWIAERERDGQVRTLIAEAEAALAATEGASPAETISHVDRLQSLCARILHLRPGDPRAMQLAGRAGELQGRAIAMRVAAARRSVVRRAGVLALVGLACTLAFFAWMLDGERRRTESARSAMESERDRKQEALELAADASRRKDDALRMSRAIGLAQASAAARAEDPQRALLLALEAVRTHRSLDIVTELHEAVLHANLVALVPAHRGGILGVIASRAGDRLLTWSAAGDVSLWDADGQLVALVEGHQAAVMCACFAADGQTVLTGDASGQVLLFRHDGARSARLQAHPTAVRCAEFSPDGRFFATGDDHGSVRVWTRAGDPVAGLLGHRRRVRCVRWTPAGDALLTAADDGTVRWWSAEAAPLAVSTPQGAVVVDAQISADGARAVAAFGDGRVRAFDRSGSQTGEADAGGLWVQRLVGGLNGGRVATGGWDRRVRVYGADGSLEAAGTPNDDVLIDLAASPQGDRLVSVSAWSSRVSVWDTSARLVTLLPGNGRQPGAAAFVAGGERVAVAGRDGVLRIFALNRAELLSLDAHSGIAMCAQFLGREGGMLTTGTDGVARVWDAWGRCTSEIRVGSATVEYADTAPATGLHVLALGAEGAVLVRPDGTELARFAAPSHSVRMARFHPAGDRVATASWDGTARLWDLEGRELAVCRVPGGQTPWLCFTPGGERLLTAHVDGAVRVWSLAGELQRTIPVHRNSVWSVNVSADGRRMLTTSMDGTGRITDLVSGAGIELRGHEASVTGSCFLGGSRAVVTCSADRTVRVWDLDGHETQRINAHDLNIYHVASDPEGRRLLTAGADGRARMWLADEGALLRLAESRVHRELTLQEREVYADLLGEEQQVELFALRWIQQARAAGGADEDLREKCAADAALAPEVVSAIRRRLDGEAALRAAERR